MKWYYVFIKSLKEQLRDYWILALTLLFAPFFVFMYFLMSETGKPEYKILLMFEKTSETGQKSLEYEESLFEWLQEYADSEQNVILNYNQAESRKSGIDLLQNGKADAMIVLPDNFSHIISGEGDFQTGEIELVGDITDLKYIISAVWTEELVNAFVLTSSGLKLPFHWKETTLGHSGKRSEFDLYVPGLMIFAIIMMLFTASASIVREPESGTLERLKLSNLSAFEFLLGLSVIQVIIGIISLLLTIGVAIMLGYDLLPRTFGFIMLIGFLTSLSMISFSLIVSALCRSIKDVAVIGTFPLMLLMFFSGAFFPVEGGKLFTINSFSFHLNDLLSPTWAVDAFNKVLIKGLDSSSAMTEITAIVILTILYFWIGVWAFRKRHMKAI